MLALPECSIPLLSRDEHRLALTVLAAITAVNLMRLRKHAYRTTKEFSR